MHFFKVMIFSDIMTFDPLSVGVGVQGVTPQNFINFNLLCFTCDHFYQFSLKNEQKKSKTKVWLLENQIRLWNQVHTAALRQYFFKA